MTCLTSKPKGGETARSKPALVLFSPYPPSKNGIATYVCELMPYHLADFDVTLVIADDAPAPTSTNYGPRILLASEFRRHRSFFASAPKIYHVGNNPDHCYILDFIGRDPGLVVLHDYNLNFMHETATLGWQEPGGYRPALELEYGAIGADAIRSHFEGKNRGLFATYELPLNGDVLESALGIIAHSRFVQYKAAARVPRTPVWYVPHHLSPRVASFAQVTRQAARKRLGLPDREFIVTAPGFVTYAKRIPLLLASLADLRSRVPPFRLVLAGERRRLEYDVDTDIAAFGLKNITTCTDFLDEARFFDHLAACDLVANLRHPSGGETSGTLIRALGMGAPVLVFDNGPMGELPDSVVRKVRWDEAVQSSLTKALQELMINESVRLDLGARASAYATTVHGIENIARRYSAIIRTVSTFAQPRIHGNLTQNFQTSGAAAHRLKKMGPDAEIMTRSADGGLWWRSASVPLGQVGERALVVSSHPKATGDLLSALFGWRPAAILAMTPQEFFADRVREVGGGPVPSGAFMCALVIAEADLSECDSALLLRRLNAAVGRGGSIALEICSNFEREVADTPLAKSRLEQRLVDAGFAVTRGITPKDGFFADLIVSERHDTELRRSWCVTARKVSTFAVWRYMDELTGVPSRFGGRIG